MRGWKAKLVFLLIIYFAGFATAIYCLAPAPDGQPSEQNLTHSTVKTERFAKSFNVGMHKCLDFAKDATLRMNNLIKRKLNERQADG